MLRPIQFTVADVSYTLARLNDLTFDEGIALKKLTDGMAPAEVQERLLVGDPEAWMGVLVISMRRTRPGASPAELAERNLQELVSEIERDTLAALADAEADARPPDGAPAEPSGWPGERDSGTPSSATTPDASGTPHGSDRT